MSEIIHSFVNIFIFMLLVLVVFSAHEVSLDLENIPSISPTVSLPD